MAAIPPVDRDSDPHRCTMLQPLPNEDIRIAAATNDFLDKAVADGRSWVVKISLRGRQSEEGPDLATKAGENLCGRLLTGG